MRTANSHIATNKHSYSNVVVELHIHIRIHIQMKGRKEGNIYL